LLGLVAGLADELTFELFRGIADLPHFNPDIDREEDVPPPAVAAWRAAIRGADGVIISCPEYAHGLPGSFKNALDWLVSSGEFMEKPTLLLNASPSGGQFAQSALAETLRMIGAIVLEESRLEPFLRPGFWAGEGDAPAFQALHQSLRALGEAMANRGGPALAE
jgi:NAD(P)H-dependent FMN reductase